MAIKLTSRQQQQLSYLQGLPMKFATITRILDQMAAMQADDAQIRGMCRLLDEIKSGAGQLSLGSMADTAGHMVTLARRTGSQQMRTRGLRELMGSLKLNYESALRNATTAESHAGPEEPAGERGPTS